MSGRYTVRYVVGRLGRTPRSGVWTPSLTVVDPPIPYLPLETPASGATIIEATGASDGVAVVIGVAANVFNGVGLSVGVAVATGVAAGIFVGVGSSSGVATPTGVAAAIWLSTAQTSGLGAVTGETSAFWESLGLTAGIAEALGLTETLTVSPEETPIVTAGGGGSSLRLPRGKKKLHDEINEWIDNLQQQTGPGQTSRDSQPAAPAAADLKARGSVSDALKARASADIAALLDAERNAELRTLLAAAMDEDDAEAVLVMLELSD